MTNTRKKSNPTVLLAAVIILSFASIAEADFNLLAAPGTTILDASGIYPLPNAVKVKGNVNPTILTPGYGINPASHRFLSITAKSSNPTGLLRVAWVADGTLYTHPGKWIALSASSGFNTYSIDMSASPGWKGNISRLYISFLGLSDTIEISAASLQETSGPLNYIGSSINAFTQHGGLTPKTVNNVSTPYVFGQTFPAIANYVLLAASLIVLLFYAIGKLKPERASLLRKNTVVAALSLTIAIALIHDARTTYEEYLTHRGIVKGLSAADNKTELYSLGKIHGFSEFLKQTIAPETRLVSILPNDPRICLVQLKYWLYPIRLAPGLPPDASSPGAIFEDTEYAHSGGKLQHNAVNMADIEVTARFDENSFIFTNMGAPK